MAVSPWFNAGVVEETARRSGSRHSRQLDRPAYALLRCEEARVVIDVGGYKAGIYSAYPDPRVAQFVGKGDHDRVGSGLGCRIRCPGPAERARSTDRSV